MPGDREYHLEYSTVKNPPQSWQRAAYLLIAITLSLQSCDDDEPAGNNNNSNSCEQLLEWQTCNLDGICSQEHTTTENEDCLWCSDCCHSCSLTVGGVHEYIVSELRAPRDNLDVHEHGVDLDGDGEVDNRGGSLTELLTYGMDANRFIAESIQSGDYILLIRLRVDRFSQDQGVTAQVFPGDDDPTRDATEDNLTGTGHALIHPEADKSWHMCGEVSDGMLITDPGPMLVPYPFVDPRINGLVLVPLEMARIETDGSVDASGLTEMRLGGGITEETVQNVVIPSMVRYFNERIIADPESDFSRAILTFVDERCSTALPGCQNVVNGYAGCAAWLGYPSIEAISATELRCNGGIYNALRPDIDVDGDCEPDLLSLGFKFSAIPVTIDN